MGKSTSRFFLAALSSLGLAMPAIADILVRNDGVPLDGKVVSQTSAQVIFQQDGQATSPQHLDQSTIKKLVLADEHGALRPGSDGATTQPAHWTVPPEPPAPPVVLLSGSTYYVIPLHGEVGATVLASALEKSFADALLRKPTVVVLDINSPGGLVEESEKITKLIHRYNKKLRIVALTDQDLSAAAIFSLSVKEIYVKSSSTIGAATSFVPNNLTLPPKIEEKMQSAWRAVARNSAEEGGHEPLLAEAMIDNDMALHLETSGGKSVVKEGTGDKMLCRKGKILTLSSHEAVDCGLAAGEADDFAELGEELKMPGWTECKGLAGPLADYLPKRNEAFKAESMKVLARFQENMKDAEASDPEQVVRRLVRTGPTMMVRPNRFGPAMPQQQTAVVTTVSHAHWKSRSLLCVLALQQAEANLAEEAAMGDAFGQQSVGELFREYLLEIGVLRAHVYDDRNKYGTQDTAVAVAPPTNPTTRPLVGAPAAGALPTTPDAFYDRLTPKGATRTPQVGNVNTGGLFIQTNPGGAPLIGFRFNMAGVGPGAYPRLPNGIYVRQANNPAPNVVVAKEGYAVAGLNVEKSASNSIIAIRIVFARLEDGKLLMSDSYTSDWFGNSTGENVEKIDGHGRIVLGCYGHRSTRLDAIGLVLAPEK